MRALFIAGGLFFFVSSAWAQDETAETVEPTSTDESIKQASDKKEPAKDTEPESEVKPEAAEKEPEAEPEVKSEVAEEEPETEPEVEPEVDPASKPPVQPITIKANALNTRLSGRLRSEMFLSQRVRMRNLGGGRYATRSMNVYPFYETIELRADEVGHKGLSVHFQGWAGLDLADVYFEQRVVADPTYLYVQFKDYGANIKVGRQMVYTGATQGLHLDGIHASYESPIHLGIEALGGLVVTPYRGPNWYREQQDNLTSDDFGAGFTDWGREGDYAVGGRLFYRMVGKISVGASILHVTKYNEIDRQLFGVDFDMTPVKWLGASGNATMDLLSTRLREGNVGLDFYPADVFDFSLDYRHADPTLYLSHMSIFSVFSTEEYDSVGASARLKPVDWLHIDAGYHQHFYSSYTKKENTYAVNLENGYEMHLGLAAHYARQNKGLVLLNYRRLGENEQGLHEIRAGVIVPIVVSGLRATANAYLDLFDEKVNATDIGFMGDIGLFYGNDVIEGGGFVAAGATPYADSEIRGMLKLVYNFDISFVERRE